MNFDKAFEIIIGHEGGYVHDYRDPGGETKFGISKRAYPSLNIKDLTLTDAKVIYLADYWVEIEADLLPESARLMVFDCAVNCGVAAAKKLLQRAVGVKDDGIIGPKTKIAISNTPDIDRKFAGHWLQYYTDLKQFDIYGRGWIRRVSKDLIGY